MTLLLNAEQKESLFINITGMLPKTFILTDLKNYNQKLFQINLKNHSSFD